MKDQTWLYVDSSIIVSFALGDPAYSKKIESKFRGADALTTSEIAVVECQAGITAQLASMKATGEAPAAEQNLNRILSAMEIIAVNSVVLGRARALVKLYRANIGLRSLDAIHVGAAQILKTGLSEDAPDRFRFRYLTADRRQHEAFSAEGWIGDFLEA